MQAGRRDGGRAAAPNPSANSNGKSLPEKERWEGFPVLPGMAGTDLPLPGEGAFAPLARRLRPGPCRGAGTRSDGEGAGGSGGALPKMPPRDGEGVKAALLLVYSIS